MSNIMNRDMTETEGRSHVAKIDRAGWFPGTHAHNAYGILARRDGREVSRSDRRDDRDAILAMARSHDALRSALAGLVAGLSEEDQDGLTEFAPQMQDARAALKLAESVK